MKIVVLDGHALNPGDLSWKEIAALGELEIHPRTAPADVVARCRNAEVVLTNKTPLPAEVVAELDKTQLISVLATGYNVVDVAAARSRGITVCNVPAYGTGSVAQFTFALILELCHHTGLHGDAVHAGEWTQSPDFSFWKSPLVELEGKVLGIVGFGAIGRRVGLLGRAFGMEVWATQGSRSVPLEGPGFAWKTIAEIFTGSDVVTLHCPQTPANQRFVSRTLLETMRPSAFLVNTARGGLIDEDALAEALRRRHLAGAALDVLSHEPPLASNPLLAAPNCIITPHIAWATREARSRLMRMTAENIIAFLAGNSQNVV